jgi:molecular chaperone GrpE
MNTDVTDNQDETAETPAADAPAAADPQTELEKFRDAALRARAELDNYRKRVVREKEDAIRYANASLLESLLPILDNFELGLGAARQAPDASGIVLGLEMVRKQLEDFLRSNGLEVVDATGQTFDPNLHEAVGQEASADVPEGTVIRQLRRGYKLRDRLIRPASVFVSKGAE